MILVVFLVTILAACNGDVSHLDTDLREDGYHYKQPLQPFPQDNSGIDNQLSFDVSQQKSDLPSSPPPRPYPSRPSRPTSEYLPPVAIQPMVQPTAYPQLQAQPQEPMKDYGTASTFVQQLQPEPTKEYGSPTTFAPQVSIYSSAPKQVPSSRTPQEYVPPLSPQQKPQIFVPKSNMPKLNNAEREYLPPGENEISSDTESKYIFPRPQPTVSQYSPPDPKNTARQPTNIPPKPTEPEESTYESPEPTFPAPQSTYQTPQSTYLTPESTYPGSASTIPESQPTFPVPKPTYIAPQPLYTDSKVQPTPVIPAPQHNEPEPAHELGSDGYKYKIPTNSFKY